MLEESELLVCPWAAEPNMPGTSAVSHKRLIRAPATGRFLGFARTQLAVSWWSWLCRQTVQVCETEDASLLMTIYRPRGLRRTWEVHDAEERRVGYFYRHVLWEAGGTRLAVLQRPSAESGRFTSPTGIELATFGGQPDKSILLTFNTVLAGKPFARMILLAAVLSSHLS